MWMPSDHLLANGSDDIIKIECLFFLGQLRIKYYLEKEISKLIAQLLLSPLLYCMRDLVGFFQGMRHYTGIILLQIPWTSAPRLTQPRHNTQQIVNIIFHRYSNIQLAHVRLIIHTYMNVKGNISS